MYAVMSKEKMQLSPGTVVRMPASWQDYQQLSQQRGDSGHPRLKYRSGEVLLMSALAQHGRDASQFLQVAYERNTSAAIRLLRQILNAG